MLKRAPRFKRKHTEMPRTAGGFLLPEDVVVHVVRGDLLFDGVRPDQIVLVEIPPADTPQIHRYKQNKGGLQHPSGSLPHLEKQNHTARKQQKEQRPPHLGPERIFPESVLLIKVAAYGGGQTRIVRRNIRLLRQQRLRYLRFLAGSFEIVEGAR